ncbi:MAG: RluA family pseudouridine synthase [Betaproteobacteria bacterium]|nr:RluA family pseudouridine synthase [Betaproteobacteria bacterium]
MKPLGKDSATWIEADETVAGQRVDNMLLKVLKGVPRQHIYRLVRTGQVRVNSARVDPTYRVQAGDRVRIPPVRIAQRASTDAAPAPAARFQATIVHEDDHLAAIDKPAGIAVHGGSGISRGVIEEMRLARPRLKYLELVHRLDRDTSGVLLLAKKRSALVALHAAIREGAVRKLYTLLVRGRFLQPRREVDVALEKYLLPGGDRRVKAGSRGLASRTVFTLERHIGEYSLLQAELITGRTHQIRVHGAHIGHPIAGDDKYGDFAANKAAARGGLKRMFLHAARIELRHPATGEPLVLEAPLPPELSAFLGRLERDRVAIE